MLVSVSAVSETVRGGATLTAEGDLSSEMFQIQLEDDDWFERTGKFVMTGMYNTKEYTDKRDKEKEIQEPAIRLSSGAEMLMDTRARLQCEHQHQPNQPSHQ